MQSFQNLNGKTSWQKVNGLIPVIIQGAGSCEVLVLGFMDEKVLEKSLENKKVVFFSHAENRLRVKGKESGNFSSIADLSLDCDNDTLLILVDPTGTTYHIGNISCFENVSKNVGFVSLTRLGKLINSRKNADENTSYVIKLFKKGTKHIAQEVGEEGIEAALAVTAKDKDELICKAADLMYHLSVLLVDVNLSFSDVIARPKERYKE